MSLRSMTLGALLVLGSASVLAAQEESPFQDIRYGETLAAYLTASDDSFPDGSYQKSFLFSGESGDSITISLISLDFDGVLIFADSVDAILGSDDNSAGQCNAHFVGVLPASGRYIIYATSKHAHRVGEFQISLAKGAGAAALPPGSTDRCSGFFHAKGSLAVGDSIDGSLGPPDDAKLGQSYYQVWALAVLLGQTVTVDLISDDFDARLRLYRGFATAVDANDDGAGKCNARLVFTGSEHPHRIVMTTRKPDETGSYVLRMMDGALSVVEQSECTP